MLYFIITTRYKRPFIVSGKSNKGVYILYGIGGSEYLRFPESKLELYIGKHRSYTMRIMK